MQAAQPDLPVMLPDTGDHVELVCSGVDVVHQPAGVVVRLDTGGALRLRLHQLGDLGDGLAHEQGRPLAQQLDERVDG